MLHKFLLTMRIVCYIIFLEILFLATNFYLCEEELIMKSLLDKISLKTKLISLIIFPFFGFLSISALYLNQILTNDVNSKSIFTIVFIVAIIFATLFAHLVRKPCVVRLAGGFLE